MPKTLRYLALIVLTLALVPPALIAWARAKNSPLPPIHYIQDMDNQFKFRAQHPNDLFADGRAMRPPVAGTVPWGPHAFEPSDEAVRTDDRYFRGYTIAVNPDSGQREPKWLEAFPPQITLDEAFMRHGQERFNIFCQPCHGLAGYGDGMVSQRAMELLQVPARNGGTVWVPAKSLHEQAIREQPVGQIFNTVTHGIRTMAGYGAQIPVRDRWAIAAYVKSLQRSQDIAYEEIPVEAQSRLVTVTFPLLPPAEEGGESGDAAPDS